MSEDTLETIQPDPDVTAVEPEPPPPVAPAAAVPTPDAVPAQAPASRPPDAGRRSGALKRWRARFVVLLMLAAAVLGGLQLVRTHTHAAALLDIGTVTLTAEPIPIQSDRLGLVTSVRVHAHDQVAAGEELGRMTTMTTNGSGTTVRSTIVLRAPVMGIVSNDPLPVGSAMQPGTAFVQLYQPSRLTLVANVALSDLPRLAPGMTATLRGAELPNPIAATVGQAIPRVGNGQSNVKPDHIAVQLLPKDPRMVAQLVPGLQFQGTVDTQSVPPGERKSVYIGP